MTGISNTTFSNAMNNQQEERNRQKAVKEKKEKVSVFLERKDNSRMNPNKGDVLNSEGMFFPKRTLTYTLKNLHDKYDSENPNTDINFSTFCKY